MTTFVLYYRDVTADVRNNRQPVEFLERPQAGGDRDARVDGIYAAASIGRIGEFWVPIKPLLEPVITWSVTRDGDHVRVPMSAYRTAQRSRACILATGLELGIMAALDLRRMTHKAPEEITLIMGHDCDVVPAEQNNGTETFRCYLGLAFRTG